MLPAEPEWDAQRGAEEVYAACHRSRLSLEQFEGPRHQRIGHIKKLAAEGASPHG